MRKTVPLPDPVCLHCWDPGCRPIYWGQSHNNDFLILLDKMAKKANLKNLRVYLTLTGLPTRHKRTSEYVFYQLREGIARRMTDSDVTLVKVRKRV